MQVKKFIDISIKNSRTVSKYNTDKYYRTNIGDYTNITKIEYRRIKNNENNTGLCLKKEPKQIKVRLIKKA